MEELVRNFNSYTEISPSGKGLHIIIKGKLPAKGRRKDGIEIYDKARFFTVTGNRMADSPNTIADGGEAINSLYDKFFTPKVEDKKSIEKDIPADNEKIQTLFRGDYQDYNSQSEADLALCQYLSMKFGNDADVIDKCFRESALFRPKWDEAHYSDGQTYGQATVQKAIESTFGNNHKKIKTSTSTKRPEFNQTDIGNAERLVYRFGDKIRYCHLWKKWLIWDERRWCPDETTYIKELAKKTVRSIYQEAKDNEDDSKRQSLAKHAVASESESRIRAMVSLAQSDTSVAISPDDFDQDKFLFNCLSGTINLKTGNISPHRKEDYITKIAKVYFDPTARCPQWQNFLNRIMDNNKNLIEFLKRAVGYSLTGDISEQCLFIFFGSGANGKSTFLNTINMITGDYGQQTTTETLHVKKPGAISNDLARLKDARFVTASEAESGQQFAESLIKQMTGEVMISARFLYQELFDFEQTYKIFLGTNHKPVIKGTDNAIWRRIKLIPFEVTIPEYEMDRNLLNKLKDEHSGILAWAVNGCLEWQKKGLGIPEEVSEATAEYRDEMDSVSSFIHECCIEGNGYHVLSRDLYIEYMKWCDENGDPPLNKNAFGRQLSEKGFTSSRLTKGAKGWRGLKLIDELIEVTHFS
jgi:putative DNA primase/helicase